MVYVHRKEIPELPEGEYYQHQLLGLRVEAEDGQDLGQLEEILPTGANDVYLIRLPNGRELLLPAIAGILLDVNFQAKTMRVRVLPGSMPE
jgi:16S rRNA processing protein RimM